MSWSEAWTLSFEERVIIVDQFKKIQDDQREAAGQTKVMRASDIETEMRPGDNTKKM